MGFFGRNSRKVASELSENKQVVRGKKFVFEAGGSGAMAGVTLMQLVEALKMFQGESVVQLNSIFETMDQGGEVIEQLDELCAMEEIWGSKSITHQTLKLADRIKSELNVTGKFSLKTLYPDWEEDMPFLAKETAKLNLSRGFYQQMSLGAYLLPTMLECALKTEEDKNCGYGAVAESVRSAVDGSDVQVAFMGSLFGGEGRTILSGMPARLFDYCARVYAEDKDLDPERAKEEVRSRLKIAEAQLGGCYKYPHASGLRDDVSDLTAGALRNFPENTEDVLYRIYYFDSRGETCPVQSEKAEKGAQQRNHHHEVELLMAAAVLDFFNTDAKEGYPGKKDKIRIPSYSVPNNNTGEKTTWEELALPEGYKEALLTRLRFDAALLLAIKPQVCPDGNTVGTDQYQNLSLIGKLYNATGAKLRDMINRGKINVNEITETVNRAAELIKREERFIDWFYDIAVSGKDWDKHPDRGNAADSSGLVNVRELWRLKNVDSEPMTYQLDRLTDIPQGNPAHTGKAVYKVMDDVKFRRGGKPRDIGEIFKDIYDNCRY